MSDAAAGVTKKRSHRRVALGKCHPNAWNPNVLDGTQYQKLKEGLKQTLAQSGEIPPIVVRRSTRPTHKYEIIDGYHRWKALGELKKPLIDVFVIKVDDKTARILTNTLNYLRGKPDRAKYAQGIVELIEMGTSLSDLASLLPDSAGEIDLLLEEADVTIAAYEQLSRQNDEENADTSNGPTEDDIWVELKFKVSASQAQVVEKEIARVGNRLKGGNVRGRALEYAMVMSSQSDLPEDMV